MSKGALAVIEIVTTVVGLGASAVCTYVGGKRQKIEIQEAAQKAVKEEIRLNRHWSNTRH